MQREGLEARFRFSYTHLYKQPLVPRNDPLSF